MSQVCGSVALLSVSKSSKLQRVSALLFAVGAVSLLSQAPAAFGVTKANNTDNLILPSSWVGGVAPVAADIAVWDNTVTGANSTVLGGNVSWAGIQVINPGGAVTIGADGSVLTLGASGINMSAATQNLTINSNIVLGAAQPWNVANSVLTIGGNISAANAANSNMTKSGNGTLLLTGNNPFAGAGTAASLTLTDGVLKLGSQNALNNARQVIVNTGGTFDINGFSTTINTLNGAAVGGTVTNNGAAGTLTLLTSTGTTSTYGGLIKDGTGVLGIKKQNNGTLTLVSQNLYTGDTTAKLGVLGVNFNVLNQTSNILPAASHLNLNGGVLFVTGNAGAAATQTVNGTSVLAGSATVSEAVATQDTILNLGAITRTVAGGTVIFNPTTGTAGSGIFTTTAVTNGILGGWAVLGATDWATRDAGANTAIRALDAGSYVNTFGAGLNTDMTGALTAGAGASTGSVRFAAAAPTTLTLSGANHIQSGGILVTAAVAANVSGIAGTVATDTLTSDGLDVVVHQNNAGSAFTIAAPIVNNGGNVVGLTKSGAGTLSLTAVNTYTGDTNVNNGVLVVQSGASLNSTGIINIFRNAPANPNSVLILGNGVTIGNNVFMALDNNGPAIDVLAGASATLSGNLTTPTNTLDQYVVGTTTTGTITFTGAHNAGSSALNTQAVTPFLQRGNIVFAGNAVLNAYQAGIVIGRSNGVNVTLKDNASIVVSNLATGRGVSFGGGQNTTGAQNLTMQDQASINVGALDFDMFQNGSNTTNNINLNGGTITAGAFTKNNNGAAQLVNLRFNGGTIVAGKDSATFLPQFANGTQNTVSGIVQAGGAKFSTNFNTTVGLNLVHDVALVGVDGGLAKAGTGTLTLTGSGNVYTGVTNVTGGSLVFAQNGTNPTTHTIAAIAGTGDIGVNTGVTLLSDQVVAKSLRVDGIETIRSNGTNVTTSVVGTLAIAGVTGAWTGKVQINNHVVIVDTANGTGSKASVIAALNDQVKQGATGTANGITSATVLADTTHKATYVVDNALLGLTTTIEGVAVNSSSVIVEATYQGDANLDRKVNVTDLGVLATFYGQNVTGFGIVRGDFDGNGIVNVSDLGILATDYGLGTAPGSTFSLAADLAQFPTLARAAAAVPEPASLAVLAVGAGALLTRRKRR